MEPENNEFVVLRLQEKEVKRVAELFALFGKVFEEANAAPVSENYLQKLLQRKEFLVYAVLHQQQIVGGLTAFVLPMYRSETSEIFIYDIAVDPEFQRKGLGKRLLEAVKDYGRQQNVPGLFVAANEEDSHALDFYKATGGVEEKVFHFTYSTKK